MFRDNDESSNSSRDEEFAQELSDLQSRFDNMQKTLNIIQANVNEFQKGKEKSNNNSNSSNNKNVKSNNDNSSSRGEGEDDNSGNMLLSQMEEFKKQAHSEQQQAQGRLEKSIKEAIVALNQANNEIKSNQALMQMSQYIEQAQMQLSQISSSENSIKGSSDKKTSNEKN